MSSTQNKVLAQIQGRVIQSVSETMNRALKAALKTLRICQNEKCGQYFIGNRAVYCSVVCANEAQKKNKRIWWEKSGDSVRRFRSGAAKRKRKRA